MNTTTSLNGDRNDAGPLPSPPAEEPTGAAAARASCSSNLSRLKCRLQVCMEITEANWGTFEDNGVKFVQMFATAGLYLKQSMVEAPTKANGKTVFTVYNYWDLGFNLNNFVNAALELPDHPDFGLLDEVIETEIKNVVLPVGPTAAGSTSPPQQPFQYLRVESHLRTADAAEFAALLAAQLVQFNQARNWDLGEAFLPVTGTDEMVVQIWTVPEGVTESAVRTGLAKAPWKHLIELLDVTLMAPTEFDPLEVARRQTVTGFVRPAPQPQPKIGDRGLVIHEKNNANDQYYFVTENAWRAMKSGMPQAMTGAVGRLPTSPKSVFVDFNRLSALPSPPRPGRGSPNAQQSDEIWIHDGTDYFRVRRDDWKPLTSELSQANAKVFVTRGADVAVVPPNAIPVGAYCVLINLDLI
jgi:hypothetical protein